MKLSRQQLDAALLPRLAERGFRSTPQREHVYSVLLEKRDHPTAEQVFLRAKESMPEISMATVYNCLDALVKCRLVREVNLNRGATRFCPNMQEHCHFYCDDCRGAFDIDFSAQTRAEFEVPEGFSATSYEIAVRGLCAECSRKRNPARS